MTRNIKKLRNESIPFGVRRGAFAPLRLILICEYDTQASAVRVEFISWDALGWQSWRRWLRGPHCPGWVFYHLGYIMSWSRSPISEWSMKSNYAQAVTKSDERASFTQSLIHFSLFVSIRVWINRAQSLLATITLCCKDLSEASCMYPFFTSWALC